MAIRKTGVKASLSVSFILLVAVVLALNYAAEFVILLVAVSLHELAHVLTARKFGRKTESVTFTGLGLRAVIRGADTLSAARQLLIYLTGPAVNLVLSLALFNSSLHLFGLINFGLFIFNMLPVLPLDGGRILQLALGRFVGGIRANNAGLVIGKIICILLFCVGLAQITLYPYNVSIVFLAHFLARSRESEYIANIFDFYRRIALGRAKYEFLPVNCHAVDEDTRVKKMIGLFKENSYNVFYITRKNEIIFTLKENDFINKILTVGYTIAREYCE